MEATILANTDFTWEFRKVCIWRSPGVLLKPATAYKISTDKLIVYCCGYNIKCLVQLMKSNKRKIFLN